MDVLKKAVLCRHDVSLDFLVFKHSSSPPLLRIVLSLALVSPFHSFFTWVSDKHCLSLWSKLTITLLTAAPDWSFLFPISLDPSLGSIEECILGTIPPNSTHIFDSERGNIAGRCNL